MGRLCCPHYTQFLHPACCFQESSSHTPFPGITSVLLLPQSPASHTFLLPHMGVVS